MMALILAILLMSTTWCFAEERIYNDRAVQCDDELSFRDFSYLDKEKYDFSGKTVCESFFARQEPDTIVFSADTSNVTFVWCHLNNVVIPLNSTIINPDCNGEPCWTERYLVQNDGEPWVVNAENKPVRPISPELFEEHNVSKDPKDIPAQKIDGSIIAEKRKEIQDAAIAATVNP